MRLIDADVLAEKLKSLHGYGDFEANIYCAENFYGLGDWVWENPGDYGLEEAEKALKVAPTIEAEPVRHGRWIQDQQSKFEHRYNCSVCNSRLIGEPTNYCHNCGARLDAEESENLVNHTSLRIPRDQWEDAARYE